jgi:hypothetical protein
MYEHIDKRGERLGVLRCPRQETVSMRHKVSIAMDDRYGILPLREFATLAGLPFLEIEARKAPTCLLPAVVLLSPLICIFTTQHNSA